MGKSIKKLSGTDRIEQILAVIHEYIFDGDLKPGDELPSEKEFSEKLGVSRFSLREALRVAQTQGLIDINQGKKPTIAHPSATPLVNTMSLTLKRGNKQSLFDLVYAREALECKIVRIAAEKIDEESLGRLDEIISQMGAEDESLDHYVQLDSEFHKTILKSTDSLIFDVMLSSVNELISESRLATLKAGGVKRANDAHIKIFQALKEHDPDLAEKEMRRHLMNAEEDLKAFGL